MVKGRMCVLLSFFDDVLVREEGRKNMVNVCVFDMSAFCVYVFRMVNYEIVFLLCKWVGCVRIQFCFLYIL
jgi:hypothetical protein